MGHSSGNHHGFQAKGALPRDAGHKYKGDNSGQTRFEEHVRVPRLQNQDEGADVRVDVQSEDQGQTR